MRWDRAVGVVRSPRGDLRFTGRRESVKVPVMVKRAHGSGFWILWSLWMFWLRAWQGQAGDDVALVGLSDRWRYREVGSMQTVPE
ncbi:MAG: hypothetical protein EBU81_04780, partial [Proteobacteria bacterium]|nr:hypothetical protein [Pseudomonadota bacterium]